MSISKALYSSNSDEWSTPQHIFDELNVEFGFDLDPCATDKNHKCAEYYTIEQDGLQKMWGGVGFSAIRHIAIYLIGLRRRLEKQGMITL